MGTDLHEKNVQRPRGRPSKRWLRAGGLKLSAAVETATMNAGCVLYNTALHLPKEQHEAAKQHASRRMHTPHAAMRRAVPSGAIRPPKNSWKWPKWLSSSVSSTEEGAGVRAAKPLVLARTLFNAGHLSSECERLGLTWAAFWASAHLRTTFSAARGFGLEVVGTVAKERVVARGLVEKDYDEPGYQVSGGGTMHGPAALANAACREDCANAIFRVRKGEWQLVAKRALRVGEEVLVHYPAQGKCVCGHTGQWA